MDFQKGRKVKYVGMRILNSGLAEKTNMVGEMVGFVGNDDRVLVISFPAITGGVIKLFISKSDLVAPDEEL